jgi:hypothetical protein
METTEGRRRAAILVVAYLFAHPMPAGSQGHAPPAASAPQRVAAERARLTMTLDLVAAADSVFPLFGPVREASWAPDWHPRMVFPTDGSQSADGAVFIVAEGSRDVVWVMTEYDPSARIVRYVHVAPNDYVGQIDIDVTPVSATRARARVTYTLTAISDSGAQVVTRFRAHFGRLAPHWTSAINRYLRTGTPGDP